MKKTYKLEELGCANCAMKMEEAIKKLEGVNDASINFMTAKLKIDYDENLGDGLVERAQKEISKIERDCKIVL